MLSLASSKVKERKNLFRRFCSRFGRFKPFLGLLHILRLLHKAILQTLQFRRQCGYMRSRSILPASDFTSVCHKHSICM
jgi:hypothetical protein